jgi:hypothetical protein
MSSFSGAVTIGSNPWIITGARVRAILRRSESGSAQVTIPQAFLVGCAALTHPTWLKTLVADEMNLITEAYLAQSVRWPRSGRHILAQFDAESVVVYQAYNPAIGHFTARHGYFGGGFGLGRMSWIKPNFLWMMYRSGWGTKEKQEVTLAVRLRRDAFDDILRLAVHSIFVPDVYGTQQEWKQAVAGSDVRLQWDPDHGPSGYPVERRAIQLGLRGDVLARYAKEWLFDIEDISAFVAEQRAAAAVPYDRLVTPREDVYPIADAAVAARLGVSEWQRVS